MNLSKRDFLKKVSLATLAMPFAGQSAWAKSSSSFSSFSPISQDPWTDIRDSFSLTHGRVYFNNGTIGPSPDPVLHAVTDAMKKVEFMSEHNENDGVILRQKLAAFVGVTADEISLTHNTTEGINIVAQGLKLSPGDEVIISTHEHVGNALPWLNRSRLDGIVLRSFVPAKTAVEVIAQISDLMNAKTKVIAVPHISCTTGQVFPIEELTQLAHQNNCLIFVDGAHGAGMLPLTLRAWDVDFYASCGHKWMCGPKGTGFLYVKKEYLNTVEATFVGANSDTGWSLTPPSIAGFNPTAHRYDYGSQNTALYAGLVAAVDFFTTVGMKTISEHGCGLAKTLQDGLLAISGVEMLTPTEDRSRAMMVSFRFTNPSHDYKKFAAFAGQKGFRIRQVAEADLFALRISTHLYNSEAEVLDFLKVVSEFSLSKI